MAYVFFLMFYMFYMFSKGSSSKSKWSLTHTITSKLDEEIWMSDPWRILHLRDKHKDRTDISLQAKPELFMLTGKSCANQTLKFRYNFEGDCS